MNDRRQEETRITDQTTPNTWSTLDNGPQAPGKENDDQRIYMDVCDRLRQFNITDCTKIDVSVNAGVVTLAGNLPGADMQRIGEIVRSVVGVRDMENNLNS